MIAFLITGIGATRGGTVGDNNSYNNNDNDAGNNDEKADDDIRRNSSGHAGDIYCRNCRRTARRGAVT